MLSLSAALSLNVIEVLTKVLNSVFALVGGIL